MLENNKVLYFRRKNRATYAINLQRAVSTPSLLQLLSKREAIPLDNILLIHRGKPQLPSGTLHQLPGNSIIHVIDLAEVRKQQLQITIKHLDNTTQVYSIRSEARIQQFIKDRLARVDALPYFYVGLVYAGKMLDPTKTFREEFVENGCEVIIVDINNYINRKKGEGQSEGVPAKEGEGKEERLGRILKIMSMQQTEGNSDGQLKELDSPLFNIQVSQVESVSTQSEQRNLVSFHNEERPFQDLASQLSPFPSPAPGQPQPQSQIHPRSLLKQSDLTPSDLILIGQHEGKTRSFIDRLMKRYKLVLD